MVLSNFEHLPNEIQLIILNSIEALYDVLNCRLICSVVKSLIDADVRLQYRLELASCNKMDGRSCPLTTTERLNHLRDVEKAWSRLAWRENQAFRIDLTGTDLYMWRTHGSVFATLKNGRFSCTALRSSFNSYRQSHESWPWSIPEDSIESNFLINTTQDLVAVVTRVPAPEKGHFIIQLKSAASGMAHREATLATFDAFTPTREGTWTLDIDVNNPLLGIAFMTYGFCKMIIWNWREGEMIMEIRCDHMRGFIFIDDHFFLTSNLSRMAGANDAELWIYRISALPSASPHLGILQYPRYAGHGSSFSSFDIISNPTSSGPSLGQKDAPFYTSRDERIIVLRATIGHESDLGGFVHSMLTQCIGAVALRKIIYHMEDAEAGGLPPPCLLWNDWALHSSRMFFESLFEHSTFLAISGARYLDCTHETYDGVVKLRLTLRDFSQRAFSRGAVTTRASFFPAQDELIGWKYHSAEGIDEPETDMFLNRGLDDIFDANASMNTVLPFRSTSRLIDVPAGAFVETCSAALAGDNILLAYEGRDETFWIDVLPM